MATRLNQILAIRDGVRSEADSTRAALLATLANDGLFAGLTQTYEPKANADDPATPRYAGKATKVQVTVPEVIDRLSAVLTRLFDVELTQDMANTTAKADIVATGPDGKQVTIATGIPTTYLLSLERKLAGLREFIEALPVLDLAKDWDEDGAPAGQWRTPVVVTDKTKKVPRNHVKFKGDQYHDPQIETFAEDVIEGYWNYVYFSGGIPARTGQLYLDRLGALQRAVKYAREEANTKEIHDEKIGADLLRYIFG